MTLSSLFATRGALFLPRTQPCRSSLQKCRPTPLGSSTLLQPKHRARFLSHRRSAFPADAAGDLSSLDRNQLHTALTTALAAEDYALAARIRDALAAIPGLDPTLPTDWQRLGVPEWLADRAESMGFTVPTEVQRRAAVVMTDHNDSVIESETGSGKTLAFLLPALSMLTYPPEMYPEDLPGPALVVVVPTRELGVQVVMLTYKLFGGSVNPGIPGERANMFRYHGPRGLKVRGLLLEEEVESALAERYLAGVHVVVGTPDLISQAMELGVDVTQHCQVLVVDELDACYHEHRQSMHFLMDAAVSGFSISTPATTAQAAEEQIKNREAGALDHPRQRPTIALVGATIDDKIIEEAVAAGWVRDPVRVSVGNRMRAPAGLQHRYIVVEPTGRIGAMCRQLRADLRAQSPDAAPARVMMFADDESQARTLADPLRTVLWGEHAISVLLPGGAEPIKALHSFRDNQTTLLLATPGAARGLDLPAVTHVYNVSPPKDAAEYLHRAGRAGRIGAPVAGIVTTMVEVTELPEMLKLADQLGLTMERVEAPAAPTMVTGDGEGADGSEGGDLNNVDELKRALEVALALSPQSEEEMRASNASDSSDEF